MLRSVHCGVRRYQIGGDAHTKAELCLFVSGPCVRMASPLALPLFASFASTHRPLFLPLAQVAVPPPPWLTSHTPLVPSRTSPHSRRQRVSKHSHSRPPRIPPNRPRPHPLPATRPSPLPDHTTAHLPEHVVEVLRVPLCPPCSLCALLRCGRGGRRRNKTPAAPPASCVAISSSS